MDVSGTATDLDASDPACAIQSVSCENSLSESMDVSQTACDPNASEPACAKQSESTDNNGQEAMEFSLTAQAEETAVKDAEKICFSCDKARVRKNARTLPIYSSTKVKLLDDITQNAQGINDKLTLEKISSLAADAIIYYHNSGKTLYNI
ncbi:uncharacterized protein LOC112455939 isoform X1 [Temnothorax curvispinosus]|uniref:Uncharacterized protein LOC112455939 isoform X1 n=1 Tax=Temnothorax curvispinosus TaxID=300111 RepID=A0A6J1PVL8_9HYME|nr:uncharacterized protein LOC112455939 isoform X1 [Temnothorax curvispinosus]